MLGILSCSPVATNFRDLVYIYIYIHVNIRHSNYSVFPFRRVLCHQRAKNRNLGSSKCRNIDVTKITDFRFWIPDSSTCFNCQRVRVPDLMILIWNWHKEVQYNLGSSPNYHLLISPFKTARTSLPKCEKLQCSTRFLWQAGQCWFLPCGIYRSLQLRGHAKTSLSLVGPHIRLPYNGFDSLKNEEKTSYKVGCCQLP